MQERLAFRSRIALVHVVGVVLVSALIALVAGPAAGGIVAALGLVWVLLTRRSGIEVTDEGFKVYGLFRARRLDWSQTDAFIVVSYAGTALPDYAYAVPRPAPEAISSEAIASRVHMFSLVAVVTEHGERIKVPGTAASFLDTAFPAHAAAELNRILKRHNPTATAS